MGFFDDFMDKLEEKAESENEWYEQIEVLLADPVSINTKTADELERLRFTAEMKIEELEESLNRGKAAASRSRDSLSGHKQGAALADALTSLNNLASIPADGRLRKNRHLLKLIREREQRDRVALPEPSKAERLVAQHAQRDAERQELITLLEKQRDDLTRKHPEQTESITRRYRKLIEAAIEDE